MADSGEMGEGWAMVGADAALLPPPAQGLRRHEKWAGSGSPQGSTQEFADGPRRGCGSGERGRRENGGVLVRNGRTWEGQVGRGLGRGDVGPFMEEGWGPQADDVCTAGSDAGC